MYETGKKSELLQEGGFEEEDVRQMVIAMNVYLTGWTVLKSTYPSAASTS